MSILFDFVVRVVLVGLKAPLDRLRSDDSILPLVCKFGCFDNKVVRDALECLGSYAWTRGAVKDGAVQRYAISRIKLPI